VTPPEGARIAKSKTTRRALLACIARLRFTGIIG
jgi:hypothetical protein